jgi:hypothetical protein
MGGRREGREKREGKGEGVFTYFMNYRKGEGGRVTATVQSKCSAS